MEGQGQGDLFVGALSMALLLSLFLPCSFFRNDENYPVDLQPRGFVQSC
jgi:hypothetical protein